MFDNLALEKPSVLDITSYGEKTAKELSKAIENAVKDTQAVIVRALPYKIVMKQDQYKLLAGKLLKQEYEGQEFYLYRTKQNVMEIEIKD